MHSLGELPCVRIRFVIYDEQKEYFMPVPLVTNERCRLMFLVVLRWVGTYVRKNGAGSRGIFGFSANGARQKRARYVAVVFSFEGRYLVAAVGLR